jgi:thiamine pyrophosphate-dependent acetolactate synthase large subunit-like protein
VLIDFPIDILFTPIDRPDKIAWGAVARPLPSLPGPSIGAIQEAIKLWRSAERPVIITGTGSHGSEVVPSLFMPQEHLTYS